jgi:hypothetical protein
VGGFGLLVAEEGLEFLELLVDELLVDFEGLVDLALVVAADGDALVDFLDLLLGLLLEVLVLGLDGGQGLLDLEYLMILKILSVLINTLHAHHSLLLLAVKHQVLPVDVALRARHAVLVARAAARVLYVLLGLVTCLAAPLSNIGGLALGPDI